MSFLTDLFKGNFGKLGTDLGHDPLGTAAAILGTAGLGAFALPALAPALGIGAAEAGAAGAGAAGAAEGAGGAAGAALGAEEAGAAGLAGLGLSDVLPGAAALGTGGIGSDAASAAFAADAALPGAATPTAFSAGPGITNIAGGATAGLGGGSGAAAGGTDASSLLSSITGFPTAHPLLTSLAVGGAGTLLAPKLSNLINKVPQQKQLQQLQGQEAQLAAQSQQLGTTLTNPLVTGQLPPDAMASWQSAVNDAVNTTKARYANLGLSGSTMESDALAKVQTDAQSAKFSIASQMAQTGLSATNQAANAMGLQDQVFSQLMNAQVQQDAALQSAIARFAAASALGQGNKTAQAAGQALTVGA